MSTDSLLEQVYDFITEEEDGRTCAEISDDACTDVPRNFFLNAFNGTCTKLAEQLASPSLVLPWLLAAIGAPTALTGFLVPIRRAGALLPQLAIAGRIRAFPVRKWFWTGAGLSQAIALALMVPAVLLLPPLAAGIAVLVLLAVFSIASGVGSVSFKDVMAKTIPRGRRGRLLAVRATAGGVLALGAGLLLRGFVAGASQVTPFLFLIAAAAVLWLLGTGLFALIEEEEGATGGGRNTLEEARAGLKLLRENPAFSQFVLARALLITVNLSIPFYSLHGRQLTGGSTGNLGVFIIAISLANILSSPVWGRFADRSSRKVMAAGSGLAAITGGLALLFGFLPQAWQSPYLYAVIFLSIGFSQAGVRLGRKTYLVDGAPGEQRPLYVAVSNTAIGIVILAGSAFGLIAQAYGLPVLIAVFAGLALLGALVSWGLPEAENLAE